MSERFGAKKIYGFSMFLCGVLSFVSPWVVKWQAKAFMALRVIQGACEGVTFPSLYAMTAQWVPLGDRSRFIAKSMFSTTLGIIITLPMCGAIVNTWGWEMAFHIIGVINSIWFLCWWFLVYDTPSKHPWISKTEREQIEEAIKTNVTNNQHLQVPWKAILTSIPFHALVISDFCSTWGVFTMAIYLPSYLKLMLGMDIANTGIFSSVPMLCRYIGGLFLAYIADRLIKRDWKIVRVRNIFHTLSQSIPAFTMALTAFSGCDPNYVIIFQCIGFFFNGGVSSGYFSSFVDLAPNFVGTLCGIANTFTGGGVGFIIPLVIGSITQVSQKIFLY